MSTILYTYEFGAGLGHLNRLIAVAKRLRGANRHVFAVPDMRLAEPIIRRAFESSNDVEIQQGIFWPSPSSPSAREVPTHTFADVIRLFGFHRTEALFDASRRSLDLLKRLNPDLVVSDFAPTLRIASFGRVPTVVVGNGYTVPPGGQLLPVMRPWRKEIPAISRMHESLLLAGVNMVRSKLAGSAVDYFADLFQGEQTYICTLAEFDPYQNKRTKPPVWPFNIPRMPEPLAFDLRDGANIFCYLQHGHPAVGPLIAAFNELNCSSEIYVQGVDPANVVRRCSPKVKVHTSPADFSSVLPRASLLVHHAGLGTAYAGLAAGVPQVVFPLNLEHAITSQGLKQFNVALPLKASPPPDATNLRNVLEQALTDHVCQSAALRAATELQSRRDDDPLQQVIAACAAFL